ncbi:unnamed protein product [Rhodiola kirilowii]
MPFNFVDFVISAAANLHQFGFQSVQSRAKKGSNSQCRLDQAV